MRTYWLVALGGALGSVARFWCASIITRELNRGFPVGTLFVNVTGSFVIGLLSSIAGPDQRWALSDSSRAFLMIGVLGGYTTFSSFSLQTLDLARNGRWGLAGLNVLCSVSSCLAAVTLGHYIATLINGPRQG